MRRGFVRNLFLLSSLIWVGSPMALAQSEDMKKANQLYSKRQFTEAAALYARVVQADPENLQAWNSLSSSAHLAGDLTTAMKAYHKLKEHRAYKVNTLYNMACVASLNQDLDAALAYLELAYKSGYNDKNHMLSDTDLDNLRNHPDFRYPQVPEIDSVTLADGTQYRFALVKPVGYQVGDAPPVLLAFAPGTQDQRAIGWALGMYWGAQLASAGWLVISPEGPKGGWFTAASSKDLADILQQLKQRFTPQGGRFHLAGASNGGVVSYHVATLYPQMFATLTVFPGYARNARTLALLPKLKDIKITSIRGENEDAWWIERIDETHNELKRLGLPLTESVDNGSAHVIESLFADGFKNLLQAL